MKTKIIIKILSIATKALGRRPTRSNIERRMQHSQDMEKQFQDAGLRPGPPPRRQKRTQNQHSELPKKTYKQFLRQQSDYEARSDIKHRNKKR